MERPAQPTQHLNQWFRIEFALLAYGIWQARSLAEAWLHSPFDRFGWMAFLFWLAPWWWPWLGRIRWSREAGNLQPYPNNQLEGTSLASSTASLISGTSANTADRDGEPDSNGTSIRAVLMISGFGLAFLGDLGSINVAGHAGLALILVSMSPSRTPLGLWGASAVAWMPAMGWFGSRLALEPASLNTLRIAVAVLGAICARHGMKPVAAFVSTRLAFRQALRIQPRSHERSYGTSKAQILPRE